MSNNEEFRIGDTVQYKNEDSIYTIVDVYHDAINSKVFYYTLASGKKIVKDAIESNVKHATLKRYQIHRIDIDGLEEVLNNIDPKNSFQIIPEACGNRTLFVVIEKYKEPKVK